MTDRVTDAARESGVLDWRRRHCRPRDASDAVSAAAARPPVGETREETAGARRRDADGWRES